MLRRILVNQLFNANSLINVTKFPAVSIHTTNTLLKNERMAGRKEMLASLPARDQGTAGESNIDMDSLIQK